MPTLGAVHPYPGLPARPEAGPLLVVFLSSDEDLDRLSRKWTHHLYFDLVPCSQTALSGPELFNGPVFMATRDERHKWLASPESTSRNLYKVYIPLDAQRIMAFPTSYGALDVPEFLETSRRDGLCLMLGGGLMSGMRLVSNLVPIPLSLRGTSLVVTDDSQSGK
jgi:hypothetical protein